MMMTMKMRRTVLTTSSLLILLSSVCHAFMHPNSERASFLLNDKFRLNARFNDNLEATSRREWFTGTAAKIVGFSALVNLPRPSHASVFVDPDRYGDKELKVATVNKLRQTIRDSIVKDPKLAPLFLKVAIQDALTYNSETQQGGPDGSIVKVILSPDAPASLASLKSAALKLAELENKIKRTTEITMADVVAFAGAEAIESTGGPRVVVQLGKLDPKQVSLASSYPDLANDSNGNTIIGAFLQSGLTEREVALLFGAVGAMENVVSSLVPEEEIEEEENEMGEKEMYVATSFGGPSEIYGKQLGKLDNSIFVSIANDLKKGKQPFAAVFTDDKVKEWVAFYTSKKKNFLTDVPSAYEKLMALGTRYTGGKVDSLLGSGDSDV